MTTPFARFGGAVHRIIPDRTVPVVISPVLWIITFLVPDLHYQGGFDLIIDDYDDDREADLARLEGVLSTLPMLFYIIVASATQSWLSMQIELVFVIPLYICAVLSTPAFGEIRIQQLGEFK